MQSAEDNFYLAHFSPEGCHQQVCHQNILGVRSFVCQGRSLLVNLFSSVVKAVCYATLHLWVVIKAVLEVVVTVCGPPVLTGGLFI